MPWKARRAMQEKFSFVMEWLANQTTCNRVVQVVWDLSNPWLRLHQALFPGRIMRTRKSNLEPRGACGTGLTELRGAADHPATQVRPPQGARDRFTGF